MNSESLALQLEQDPGFRVLRRIPDVSTWPMAPRTENTVRACVVDTETTGLESTDEVIELAILPFDYDKVTGRLVAVHVDQALNAFCEPEKPISAEAAAVHGITPEMVAGHSISDADVAAAVGDAKLLLAHSARFDRAMVSKSWPLLDAIAWGCTWDDIDWRSGGYESGKLAYLLFRMGYFFNGHRAMDDCIATLFALSQSLGPQSALAALLESLRKPVYKVMLFNTPYSSKDLIKARGGYRWDDKHPAGKNWWLCTPDPAAEHEWFTDAIGGSGRYVEVRVPTTLRHSDRLESL